MLLSSFACKCPLAVSIVIYTILFSSIDLRPVDAYNALFVVCLDDPGLNVKSGCINNVGSGYVSPFAVEQSLYCKAVFLAGCKVSYIHTGLGSFACKCPLAVSEVIYTVLFSASYLGPVNAYSFCGRCYLGYLGLSVVIYYLVFCVEYKSIDTVLG